MPRRCTRQEVLFYTVYIWCFLSVPFFCSRDIFTSQCTCLSSTRFLPVVGHSSFALDQQQGLAGLRHMIDWMSAASVAAAVVAVTAAVVEAAVVEVAVQTPVVEVL